MVDNAMNSTDNQTEEKENKTETSLKDSVEAKADENLVKLQELQAKYDEINEKYVRLFSEFDNYRRRSIKERAELLKTAGEDVLKEIIPVWDDFERAKKAIQSSENVESEKKGFDLIYQKFIDALKKQGIEEMQCAGLEFNPDLHEAVTEIPAPSEDLKGKIVDVVEKGYFLHGKILKYAKVVVGKA
jgi:molecular chaperone GrpE